MQLIMLLPRLSQQQNFLTKKLYLWVCVCVQQYSFGEMTCCILSAFTDLHYCLSFSKQDCKCFNANMQYVIYSSCLENTVSQICTFLPACFVRRCKRLQTAANPRQWYLEWRKIHSGWLMDEGFLHLKNHFCLGAYESLV